MTNVQKTPPAGLAQTETFDAARIEKAKDLLHYLANTVSAMKIFPSEHATVKNFVGLLTQKFTAFLGAYDGLQVGIEEYAFTYGGKPVFIDEVAIKSLPFFFFKDGLQILFFYPGLDRSEIVEFLELIKSEAQKAAEDSDVVVALWERDFPNIQYYAPDEFLENRILSETEDSAGETIEVHVDAAKLQEGRIELDSEDRSEVEKAAARPEDEPSPPAGEAQDPEEAATTDASERGQISPAAAMDPTLTESELHALETMVRANRTISPEEEYIDLMVEILYLDENPANFRASLDTLLDYHFDQLQRGHFQVSVLIIQKIHDLGRHLAGNPAKAALLGEFLQRTISPKTVEAVRTLLAKKKSLDWESFLEFFELIGPPSLGLAGDLFEIAPDGEARHKIGAFIEKSGGRNPGHIAALADNARPDLALEILGILSRIPDNRGIPHLSAFMNFQNKDVKSATIHVLAQARDEMANRLLAGFLNDPDEEIRIQAALALDPGQGGARVQQILREASAREFQAKSLKEKEALLSFLGRTRSAEALEFLSRTLFRAPLLGSKRHLELRLAAVAGLESMGTDKALDALRRGAVGRTKKVREACAASLDRRPAAGPSKG